MSTAELGICLMQFSVGAMLDCKPRWSASRQTKPDFFKMILKLPLPICFHMTRCRRSELIMLEANVALLISQTKPARRQMQTYHPSEPRREMDPVEFLFDSTPKQNMICLIKHRRMSFMNGERASPTEGRRRAACNSGKVGVDTAGRLIYSSNSRSV